MWSGVVSEGVQLPLLTGESHPGVLAGLPCTLGVRAKILLLAEEREEEVASARRRAAGDRVERSRRGEGVSPALWIDTCEGGEHDWNCIIMYTNCIAIR